MDEDRLVGRGAPRHLQGLGNLLFPPPSGELRIALSKQGTRIGANGSHDPLQTMPEQEEGCPDAGCAG